MLFFLAACSFDHLAFLDPYAALTAGQEQLAFGEVAYGTSAELAVALDNAGSQPAPVTLAVDAPFSVDVPELTVPAHSSQDVLVGFTPVQAGSVSGTLLVTLDGGATLEIGLTGALDPDGDDDGAFHELSGGDDCDDTDASVHPGASESWYDGVDQDCDGNDSDADGDGHDASQVGGDDCDDSEPSAYPGGTETWYDGIDGDCDGADDYDADEDGFASDAYGGLDCDDDNPRVSPDDAEVWYDGVDQDCDGADDYDADGDGDPSDAHGGTDCDDAASGVYGGAAELDDGIDQDCDGFVDEDFVESGDVVISELMLDPEAASTASGQYVELYNASSRDLVLDGWTLAGVAIDALDLAAGELALACSTDVVGDNGGLSCDWSWDRLVELDALDDTAELALGAEIVDEVAWDATWAIPEGASLELGSLDAVDNDDPASWCMATSVSVTSDLGTPGAPNDCFAP